jgi:hypothetical protein
MSERHDEVEPDVASVVAEAVGAFGGETVRVLQTDHVDGQRSWDAALIGQHTCFDPARGGAVTALEFRTGERIELAASEVSAATFGRQFGDAHETLTVMTAGDVPALLLVMPQGALEAKYARKTPPRSVLESDAVQRCETALSHLWATHGNHDLYVRDERTAGPEGAAAVEPIIGRFEGVGRDVEGWTLIFGEHRVAVPYAIDGVVSRKTIMASGLPALLMIDAPGGRILISES